MTTPLARARSILVRSLLPDRTVAGFVDAALDGSGRRSRAGGALAGLKEDAFELVTAPRDLFVALGRAVRR
ncbi:MAG: hypothetical protein ACK4N5_07985 [Myxococcales bacterium]